MDHADDTLGDPYDKINEDVGFRKAWAQNCGIGFGLPSVVPTVPKKGEKHDRRRQLKAMILIEIKWQALEDNFRTFLLGTV